MINSSWSWYTSQRMSVATLPIRALPQQRPLHVAHIVLSLDCGGLEHVVLDLLRQGALIDQAQTVICLERPGLLADEARSIGARLECLDKQPGIRPGMVSQLQRLFHDLRPDVVHTHQMGALFYAGIAARRAGVPAVIHTEHGKHYRQAKSKTRWMARFATCFAATWSTEVPLPRSAPWVFLIVWHVRMAASLT